MRPVRATYTDGRRLLYARWAGVGSVERMLVVPVVDDPPVEPELADDARVRALLDAFVACAGDRGRLLCFLRDLLSDRELRDLANRWTAARTLLDGRTQIATATELGMSPKTVNEVARWTTGLFATGGYREAHRRLRPGRSRPARPRARRRPGRAVGQTA